MDERIRVAHEATSLQQMQRDMDIVRAFNAENIGSEDERIEVIVKRCEQAGYERDRQYPKARWVAAATGPDFRVMLHGG